MGTFSFLLPTELPAETMHGFEKACIAGGYDHSPSPTRVEIREDRFILSRDTDESGFLMCPLPLEGSGHLMQSSATLMERIAPYNLLIELARGKLNQVRNQTADWEVAGLTLSAELKELVHQATHHLGQAILDVTETSSDSKAIQALVVSHKAANELIQIYLQQLYSLRHQRQPKLDSLLGCRLSALPPLPVEPAFLSTFNAISAPLSWRSIEPLEATYNWTEVDRIVEWALSHSLHLSAGPIIDFTPSGFPDWLKAWEGDALTLASFMCDYVETVITRYKGKIHRYQICTASNYSHVLGLNEEDLIRLTARVIEAAWGVDPKLEIVVGIAQPWGDYLTIDSPTFSPFGFADTLLRAGFNFAAFELEWFMGIGPRGSYCRDLLESSRLLDMFGLLGVPIQLGMAYPASKEPDSNADHRLKLGEFGYYQDGFTKEAQADWAGNAIALALAKPHVCAVYWDHLIDTVPHRFPNCGLVAPDGVLHPAMEKFRAIREAHLR